MLIPCCINVLWLSFGFALGASGIKHAPAPYRTIAVIDRPLMVPCLCADNHRHCRVFTPYVWYSMLCLQSLSMVQADRDQDCLEQFRACHIVGLVGKTRLGPFARLQWSKGELSTGLELWVRRRYISPKHFQGHWSGEGGLQGRVGAARFKTQIRLEIKCPKGGNSNFSFSTC